MDEPPKPAVKQPQKPSGALATTIRQTAGVISRATDNRVFKQEATLSNQTNDAVRKLAAQEQQKVTAIRQPEAPMTVAEAKEVFQQAPSRHTEFSAVDHRVLLAGLIMSGYITRSGFGEASRAGEIQKVVRLADALLAELRK